MAPCLYWTMSSNALSGMSLRESLPSTHPSSPSHQLLSVHERRLIICASYQEMITHLAMNSHPNPKKVLVVGGGDGGVLREVVKHSTVESAILCDIDEAVIRLSKKYLPGMSIGFQHPNVSVHIGDGFKFLADRKDEFDVIITDSSDPDGPAESLFQKPYFELIFGALKEGGVVTTQGCSSPLFFHCSLIESLILLPPPQFLVVFITISWPLHNAYCESKRLYYLDHVSIGRQKSS